MYRKQFTIMEVHHQFIKETLDEWIKLGVVKRLNLLCHSPIVCIKRPRIMKDFRELNQNYHINKYSMKEIIECIGDIGGANSTMLSTLDLTSGFWQMKLDKNHKTLQLLIGLFYFTHGTTGISRKFSKTHGVCPH